MRRLVLVLMLGFFAVIASVVAAAQSMPLWAYGYKAPLPPAGAPARPAAPEVAKTLPGSTGSFTRSQIYSRYSPADWFPNAHPPMPEIVAKGREGANIWACNFCHLQHGRGRPENAPVSGVSVSYFVQTMMDYKNGNRKRRQKSVASPLVSVMA